MNADAQSVLLVEDNEDDIFFFTRAFKKGGLPGPLAVARDGREAVAHLAGTGAFADRIRHRPPCLVFLDLKLPLMHGFEVLQWIRKQPSLTALCVVVLTSSAEPHDIGRAYQLGAAAFLLKPPQPPVLAEVMEALRANASPLGAVPKLALSADLFATCVAASAASRP